MKRSPSLVVAACLAFGSVTLSALGTAAAQEPAGTTQTAEALFRQGRDLMAQKSYAEACAKLAESQRLEPKLGTLLNLAVCHESLGKLAAAWSEYGSSAGIARREGQPDRATFAGKRIEALEARLAFVSFTVAAPPPDLALTLDDRPLDVAALTVPHPVDPGEHRLVARAPGKAEWSTVLTVPARKVQLQVAVPALEEARKEPVAVAAPVGLTAVEPVAPTVAPPPQAASPLMPSPTPVPPRPLSPLVYAGFGVGAAGLLVGTVAGIVTLARASSIKNDHCTGNACPGQSSDISGATAIANVSNVGFAVGAAGVAVGVVGLFLRPAPAAPAATVSFAPVVGPGTLGVSARF